MAIILLAIAVGLLFLKEPGEGDDFTYWSTAWDIHLRGVEAWSAGSFHDLRWPVWGLCWVFQALVGPGLFSFYAVPFFYLSISALVAYALGRAIFRARAGGWACAIAFLFCPLINVVIFRPMPDLSEGALIGVVVLCWLGLVSSSRTLHRALLALAAGLVAGVLFSNRITGVFVFGVLAAVALVTCWHNPRFRWREALGWYAAIGLVWAAFVAAEAVFYHSLTGDYLHALHANMQAKGRKGTEATAVWSLPFRFLGNLQGHGFLGKVYFFVALVGAWRLWKSGSMVGRAVVAWTVALYLAYSCSLQSLFPPRPLLRDADRFLCALGLPFSFLVVAGAAWFLSFWKQGTQWVRRRPVATGLVAVVALACLSSRSYFERGYPVAFRAYLEEVAPGTRVFTQRWVQLAAWMAHPERAREIDWRINDKILARTDKLEELASDADEFWYCRKLTWLSQRKKLERAAVEEEEMEQVPLGSYLKDPAARWELRKVINIGGLPELVFYRQRPQGAEPARRVAASTLFPGLPALPLRWEESTADGGRERHDSGLLPIPEQLRGGQVRIELTAAANTVQAATLQFHFYKGKKWLSKLEIRPYFHKVEGLDFHVIALPPKADHVKLEVRMPRKAEWIELNRVELLLEPAQLPPASTPPAPPATGAASGPQAAPTAP